MSSFKGSTVLITGGASGIGRLMGKYAIERGAGTLVIWDVNENMLDDALKEFSGSMTNVYGYVVDMSEIEQVTSAASTVQHDVGSVDILINNTGIIVGKYFHEHSHTDIARTMTRIHETILLWIIPRDLCPQRCGDTGQLSLWNCWSLCADGISLPMG